MKNLSFDNKIPTGLQTSELGDQCFFCFNPVQRSLKRSAQWRPLGPPGLLKHLRFTEFFQSAYIPLLQKVTPQNLPFGTQALSYLGPNLVSSFTTSTSPVAESILEEQTVEKPEAQQDSNQEDDPILDPPKVSTSQLLETTHPTGGRFVSNTFSYVDSNSEPPSAISTAPPSSAAEITPTRTHQKVYKCEEEPIHIPGAIQGFGALIALREDEHGCFLVRVVSENSQSVTGLQPEALFELRCFTDLLMQSDKKEFTTRFRGLKTRERGLRTNPDVFSLSLTSLLGAPLACFIAMHLVDESNLVICEFELKKDVFNPRHPPEDGLPEHPIQVIDSQATEEERLLSTKTKSKPLHAVQVARETSRQIGSMELFHVLCEIQNQLAAAVTLSEIMDVIVGLVYELTSFHRVMVYQFDETAAGQVVSEIVDPRASTDSTLKNIPFSCCIECYIWRICYSYATIDVLP